MKHLFLVPILAIATGHCYAQFPDPDTARLVIPDKLEIVWKYTDNESEYYYPSVPPDATYSSFLRVKNSIMLPDSSLVIGYLNSTRDTFKLVKINANGELVRKKEYTGPLYKGRYFSMNLDPNNNIIVVLQTDNTENGRYYQLVLGKINGNLDLLAWKVFPQTLLENSLERLVDAIVLDNGAVVVGQDKILNRLVYFFGAGGDPFGIIGEADIESSAVELKFFDSSGNNYVNQTYPPDVSFKPINEYGEVPMGVRDFQLKSLTKGAGGNFYAVGAEYNYYDEYYNNGFTTHHYRIKDIVSKLADTGAMVKTVELTSPQLFSDLQPVSDYVYGVAAKYSDDQIIAIDRDLNQVPGYGFPIPLTIADTGRTKYSYRNQFRFHPEGSVYSFYGNSLFYERYDFQGNRIWSWTDSSQVKVREIYRIQNITPLGGKQFLLEGYDYFNKLTILKLREREVMTAAKIDSSALITNSNKVLNKVKGGDLKVFPIPAKDQLNVVLPDTFTGATIATIHDYAGRLLKTEKINAANLISLNVSSLRPGYYLLTIYNEKGQSVQSPFIK